MTTGWRKQSEDAGTSTSTAETVVWFDVLDGHSATRQKVVRGLSTGLIVLSAATAIYGSGFMECSSGAETRFVRGLWEPTVQSSSTRAITRAAVAIPVAELPQAMIAARTTIGEIRKHLEAGRRASAIDIVYDSIDELLLSKSFSDASTVIRAIIQEDFPLPILLSALTISLPWRDMLRGVRAELVDVIRRRALQDGGEAKAAAVLSGLV